MAGVAAATVTPERTATKQPLAKDIDGESDSASQTADRKLIVKALIVY